jgi:hypothetical protein
MKNVHLLPTDKPSRLHEFGGVWLSHKEPTECFRNYNIYITSDEEIKEGDWILDNILANKKPIKVTKELLEDGFLKEDKRIILTTDQDLIKDGVQAIDDEFLEWFVKNPSCEEVEVVDDTYTVGEMSKLPLGTRNHKYKIIIPKEEPKQETLSYTEAAKKDERIFNSTMMKQETLEDAVRIHLDKNKYSSPLTYAQIGAKWQAERMYSEEEVENILIEYVKTNPTKPYKVISWLENF